MQMCQSYSCERAQVRHWALRFLHQRSQGFLSPPPQPPTCSSLDTPQKTSGRLQVAFTCVLPLIHCIPPDIHCLLLDRPPLPCWPLRHSWLIGGDEVTGAVVRTHQSTSSNHLSLQRSKVCPHSLETASFCTQYHHLALPGLDHLVSCTPQRAAHPSLAPLSSACHMTLPMSQQAPKRFVIIVEDI